MRSLTADVDPAALLAEATAALLESGFRSVTLFCPEPPLLVSHDCGATAQVTVPASLEALPPLLRRAARQGFSVREGDSVALSMPWAAAAASGAILTEGLALDADAYERLEELAAVLALGLRHQADRAAIREASEARFRAMFEQAGIGIALADPITGTYLEANEKACEILGTTRDELTSTSWTSLTPPEDVARDRETVGAVLRGELASATRD